MPRFYRRSRKAGLPPGTLQPPVKARREEVQISLFSYSAEKWEKVETNKIEEVLAHPDGATVRWINLDGVHDTGLLEQIGNRFGIHPLVLEDIVNTDQRPKIEQYEDFVFVVLKMLRYTDERRTVEGEQISILLGSRLVISFQERPGDVFDPIRQRIQARDSRIRKSGADYLVYRLLDTIVDNYFVILEKLGERIEDLEAELINRPSRESLQEIYHLKREVMYLRKSVWPLREICNSLEREDSPLVTESTEVFLRDLYDHTIQVMDTLENFRDMLTGMLEIYMSSMSQRMNEVMKVLTIIATIFIPLTFIAGIYGMNFDPESSPWNMPELKWRWGYPLAMAVMVLLAVSMVVYFRKKKWL
ncbi:MAG: magnesium/cobalt transporter CorA [Acidobacteriota bacterium]